MLTCKAVITISASLGVPFLRERQAFASPIPIQAQNPAMASFVHDVAVSAVGPEKYNDLLGEHIAELNSHTEDAQNHADEAEKRNDFLEATKKKLRISERRVDQLENQDAARRKEIVVRDKKLTSLNREISDLRATLDGAEASAAAGANEAIAEQRLRERDRRIERLKSESVVRGKEMALKDNKLRALHKETNEKAKLVKRLENLNSELCTKLRKAEEASTAKLGLAAQRFGELQDRFNELREQAARTEREHESILEAQKAFHEMIQERLKEEIEDVQDGNRDLNQRLASAEESERSSKLEAIRDEGSRDGEEVRTENKTLADLKRKWLAFLTS